MIVKRFLFCNLEHKTPAIKVENGCKKQGRGVLGLVLLAVLGVFFDGTAWGQNSTIPNGDGYYYIINQKNNGYYLKPATTYYLGDTVMPFLTTNTTGQAPGSLWIIKANGVYHQIIHAEDMKYVTINEDVVGNNNTHRKRMHLENRNTPDDDNDFVFIDKTSYYNIKHKTLVVNDNKFWNPSGGNQTYDDGGSNGYSGIVGLYSSDTDAGSKWTLTFVYKCVTPEIYLSPDGEMTITSVTPESTIYFTLDGSIPQVPTGGNPTDPTQLYDPNNKPTVTTRTVVKAIAVKAEFENSNVATTTIVTDPMITLTPDAYVYNGSECRPAVTVKDDNNTIPNTEYYVVCSDNTNAGTATVTITDIVGGNYIVNGSTTFTITQMSIGSGEDPAAGIAINVGLSDGNYSVTVKHGFTTLIEGADHDYTWTTTGNPGEVLVTGHGNYSGSAKGRYSSVVPGYYALHKNGVGYLKRCSDEATLSNENTFRYGNSFDANGSSIWALTETGYLQSDYYYLNVANNRTLYLSVTPVTQWRTENIIGDEHNKKLLIFNDGTQDHYLYNDNGTIKLTTSAANCYNACPISITEVSLTGPTVSDLTVLSPQQVTYLRNCYFTQKINYEFYDDGGTQKSESDKDRRIFVTMTYKTTSDTQKGIKWDFDESNGVIYNKQNSNYSPTATYELLPADHFVRAAHSTPVEKSVKFTLKPKPIVPDASKNYLLFSINGGDNYRYPYDDGSLNSGDPVNPDGKGGLDDTSMLTDPDDVNGGNAQISWKVEVDARGFYSFKNVHSNRYLYYDESAHASSDYGTLKVGSQSLPSNDSRYFFRLYKTTNSDFGTCYYIIPFSKQFAVWKSDAVMSSDYIYAALNVNKYSGQNVPIISLFKSNSESQWCIYKYEAECRVRTDFTISGPSGTNNTTSNNIFSSEGWYGKCIKESPTSGDQQLSMIIKSSYNNSTQINYVWTVDGLNAYINSTGGTPSGTQTTFTINATPSFNLDVTSLPVSAVTGTITLQLQGGGTPPCASSPAKSVLFTIYGDGSTTLTSITSLSQINDINGAYKLTADNTYSSSNKPSVTTFSGILDCDGHTVSGLTAPLFTTLTNGTVRNLNLMGVSISGTGPTGAIAGTADGASRIYNCGILPTATEHDALGNITGFTGSTVGSSDGYCGGLVGLLDDAARVINCFSYATITGGTTVAGIVGYNNQTSNMNSLKTIVVNCMYYGEITGGTTTYPVYGGNTIVNNGTTAINNYNYYRGESDFDNNYGDISNYNRSWPAEEKDLRRFEYYRSILNSNRRLCTWWVNGIDGVAPIDVDIANVGIAKWVLDPSQAPYPILKPWGKYPSIINADTARIWNWESGQWVQRTNAPDYQGKKLGELTITVKAGSHPMTLGLSTSERTETLEHVVITDMDTLNYDYCYGKVQLPYYNEVFGNSSATNHLQRYYGNYTNKVVTAWKITTVTTDGSVATYNSFVKDCESGYNYADRYCIDKDKYSENDGRAFAQGGYYYVPEGVTAITIEAYWGDAFYLQGKDNALDRVSVCAYTANGNDYKNYGFAFAPAGTLPDAIQYTAGGTSHSVPVYNDFKTLLNAVKADRSKNVYEQAVVLVGNYPFQAQNDFVGTGNGCLGNTPVDGKYGGFTFMSADFDMDNEPDFCFPFQWRNNVSRYPVMPIRFDFLPIPNLGLTMRHNSYAYAVGIMVPQGHFEMTETAFWYTTQFEPMSESVNVNHQQPLILNGGQYEQFVSHSDHTWTLDYTRNIIMGGHIWMKRFSPGSHAGRHCIVRHCPVSVMGGDFPEFYLTGIYWTGVTTLNAYNDNPHCYTNGGKFGLMAGAGMEAVKNSVFFEIDHSIIREFYGGGINKNNPVNDSITVTINNSLVLEKYCGGPKIGESKAVTTYANNTVFCGDYFGGGNGGTNLYRQNYKDLTPNNMPGVNDWNGTYGYGAFKPISNQGSTATYDTNLGYHAEFEFEVFNQSNGIGPDAVARTYYHWAQFGTTKTDDVINELKDCTVGHNFYGGGNLGTVNGKVASTLEDCTVFGNAFGAGFSATIPSFPVHDRDSVHYPYRDKAGLCHNGTVDYRVDGEGQNAVVRKYTWCYKNAEGHIIPSTVTAIPSGVSTTQPAFQIGDNWYCLTTESLENLGVVIEDVDFTIQGKSTIGTMENGVLKPGTGNVFGGGDESAVGGSTLVKILDRTKVFGNIYGGGNMGKVSGDTKVIINGTVPDETPTGNANNNNPNH